MLHRIVITTTIVSFFFLDLFTFVCHAQELPQIRPLNSAVTTYPNLSPDGRYLIYSAGEEDQFNIFRLDMETKTKILLTDNDNEDSAAIWSPDGKYIAFQREDSDGQRDIWLMDKDGENQRNLTNARGDDQHPRFSADQKYIVFDSNRDDPRTDPDDWKHNFDIYKTSFDGQSVHRLTDWNLWDMYGSLNPDGTKIVWRRMLPVENNKRGNFEIFVKDLTTGIETNLSNSKAIDTNPHWSPTGDLIVFASNRTRNGKGAMDIFVMRPDGSDIRQVTDGGGKVMSFSRPSFTQDGASILANRSIRGSTDMIIFETPSELGE